MKKSIKYSCLIIIFLGCCLSSKGQSTLSSAGAHTSTPGFQLSWTLGEIAIETYTNTSISLTQGMHQTQLPVVVITSTEPDELFDVSVFPNPSSDLVNIALGTTSFIGKPFTLSDSQGMVVLKGVISTDNFQIDISGFAQGLYVLRIGLGKSKSFTYKLLRK